MKKTFVAMLLLGAALALPGCGFDEGAGATVTVVEATPTPTPEPTPEATPTPEVTPTPAPVIEQTASGINVEKKDGVYTTNTEVNLRTDASTDADLVTGVAAGTQLTSTGVCENGWIQINYNGQTVYALGDYLTEATTDAAATTDTSAVSDGTDGTQTDATAVSDGTTDAAAVQ